jgi:trehalose/maltose hydrolase-like predicted phosphorylase
VLDALRFDDDWTLVEDLGGGLEDRTAALFTTSNGYVGLRGRADEPFGSAGDADVLVVGCYETRPYAHPERSFGVPERYQTIVGVTDPWVLSIAVDGTPMRANSGTWLDRSRRLDLRTGCITTSGTWRSPAGATVAVRTRRMASLASANPCGRS